MALISDLTTRLHSKQLQIILNQPGTATCWMHLEDNKAHLVEEHKTALALFRNNSPIWSGPIFKCVEKSDNSQQNDQLQITAMGWFQLLNKRIVHTGKEWEEMLVKSGAGYVPLAAESAQQLYYGKLEEPFGVPMAFIANDLLQRANLDVPTLITLGETAPTNSINLTVQQFQNVGEQITKLTAIESVFDFIVDQVTRQFSTYRNEISGGIVGLGVDRGPGVKFTYPGNCVAAERSSDGTRTQNRTEAIGQYGIGREESVSSIQENGLFEVAESLPEVKEQNILNAYAAVETFTLENPFKIITITPRAVNNSGSFSVPRPFEDYEVGDIVYTKIIKGKRFRVGVNYQQPIRIFGMTVNIDDNGVEKISNIQTTYAS